VNASRSSLARAGLATNTALATIATNATFATKTTSGIIELRVIGAGGSVGSGASIAADPARAAIAADPARRCTTGAAGTARRP
jgi:hypothetical protein